MDIFVRNKRYQGEIQAVVLDWAGTAVDFGCMGPAAVFCDVFKDFDIEVTIEEARQFMGLAKKDHIRNMCALPTVSSAWEKAHGRLPDESDIDRIYEKTATDMTQSSAHHAGVIGGVIDTMASLRDMDIRVGSSTGYVSEMMDVLVPLAKEQGYSPDAVVCSSDVPAGRPFPWMCYLNALQLETYPMEAMVKIGDTITDIEEGLNAGMWTIGITRTGNELGLSEAQVNGLPGDELQSRLDAIRTRFETCGAHYVVEQAADILPVIQEINSRLKDGEIPLRG